MDAACADEEDQLLYAALGVFPENSAVPAATILQLWSQLRPQLEEFWRREMLTTMVDLCLLDRTADGDIRMHDLVLLHAAELLGHHGGEVHQALLDSYHCDGWHTLPPEEPYLWRNLARHLMRSFQSVRLRELLLDERFILGKLIATGPHSVIADYDHFPDDAVIDAVRSALRLSVETLLEEPSSLAQQLSGV